LKNKNHLTKEELEFHEKHSHERDLSEDENDFQKDWSDRESEISV